MGHLCDEVYRLQAGGRAHCTNKEEETTLSLHFKLNLLRRMQKLQLLRLDMRAGNDGLQKCGVSGYDHCVGFSSSEVVNHTQDELIVGNLYSVCMDYDVSMPLGDPSRLGFSANPRVTSKPMNSRGM
jgi:hypothetical protein